MVFENEFDFTNEEKHRLDVLYGEDFQNITPNDMPLIQRYEQYKAQNNAILQAKLDAQKEETQAYIEEMQKNEALARQIMQDKANQAKARYERLRNGK